MLARKRNRLPDTMLRALAALMWVVPRALADPLPDATSYKLATGDRLGMSVVGQGELTTEVPIDQNGFVSLPLIGSVALAGQTLEQAQSLIQSSYENGIFKHPLIALRIIELRPNFVLGDVRQPGTYPFRYGSTVKSLVAAAGGYGAPEGRLQRASAAEVLQSQERVRELELQHLSLLVRRARLASQRDGTAFFAPPDRSADFDPDLWQAAVSAETETFVAQARVLANLVGALQDQKPRLEQQIGNLQQTVDAQKRQIELIKNQVQQYSQLVKSGLGRSSDEFTLKMGQAQDETNLWHANAELSRLQFDLGELDVRVAEANAAFKRQVITDLRETESQILEVELKLPIARAILEAQGGVEDEPALHAAKVSITLTRQEGRARLTLAATDGTDLQPGDIIEVKRLPSRNGKPIERSGLETPVAGSDAEARRRLSRSDDLDSTPTDPR